MNSIRADGSEPAKELSSVREQDPPPRRWCWEGLIQDAIAGFLRGSGWKISRVANTASRQHGKDIEASRDGGTANGQRSLWVTVKGYPEKSPDQQARHWFAEVVYDLVRYRTEHPTVMLGAGLPDHRTYRFLAHRIAWLRRELPFQFYWVGEDGTISVE